MGNWKAAAPIMLSLIIAVLGSYFIYQWIESQRAPKEVVQVQAEAVPVAVAAANLPWGTKIKPEMIKMTPYLKESLPAGYFGSADQLKDRNIDMLPASLNEAVELTEKSKLVREALGDHVFEKFIENKKIEWDEWRTQVTDYEIKHYLPIL